MLTNTRTSYIQGSPERIGQIYRSCFPVIEAKCRRMFRSSAEAQDVAQEVFLAVWKGLGRLRSPTSFRPWLRQLTRNQARDVLRRRRSSAAVVADRPSPRRLKLVPAVP